MRKEKSLSGTWNGGAAQDMMELKRGLRMRICSQGRSLQPVLGAIKGCRRSGHWQWVCCVPHTTHTHTWAHRAKADMVLEWGVWGGPIPVPLILASNEPKQSMLPCWSAVSAPQIRRSISTPNAFLAPSPEFRGAIGAMHRSMPSRPLVRPRASATAEWGAWGGGAFITVTFCRL